MPDFTEAAEYVRRYAEKQKDIIALGDALKEIGSIDQARKERQLALDKVTQERDALMADIKAQRASHAEFLAARETDLVNHSAAMKEVTDAAHRDADSIKTAAEAAAHSIIESANIEVRRIQAAHAETMTAANAELQAARDELAETAKNAAEARDNHAALSEGIQQMQALAKTALGQGVGA